MKKGFLTLLILILTALPALAAPTNTSGPWGVDASAFKNLSSALASPATAGKTVVVTKPMTIKNKTIDRAIEIKSGGKILYSGNVIFTGPFNGGPQWVLEKVGTGTISFQPGSAKEIPIEWTGAKGDGATEDTQAIYAARDSAVGIGVTFGPKTYRSAPIIWKSGVNITFNSSTVLQAVNGLTDGAILLSFDGVTNCVFKANGGTIKMNKAQYLATWEQIYCVMIRNCSNIFISDLIATGASGDGFWIGSQYGNANTDATNVVLQNCNADNNGRQGLSITAGIDVWINGGVYSGTNGTAPQYGIDIEPDGSWSTLRNINLNGVTTRDNKGGGILVALSLLGNTADKQTSISIDNCKSYNDGDVDAAGALRFYGRPVPSGFKISGEIFITNHQIIRPKRSGIQVAYWNTDGSMPHITMRDIAITDVGFGGTGLPNYDKSGLVTWNFEGVPSVVGNYSADNVRVYDSRATVGTYSPVYFAVKNTTVVRDVTLHDVSAVNFTPLSNQTYVSDTIHINAAVNFTTENIVNRTSDFTFAAFPGQTVVTNSIDLVGLLPLAAEVTGQRFKVRLAGSYLVQIRPVTGDVINWGGLAASSDLILNNTGDTVTLVSRSAGIWEVENIYFKPLSGAGSPIGLVSPWWSGRDYLDTTNNKWYRSNGGISANWLLLN